MVGHATIIWLFLKAFCKKIVKGTKCAHILKVLGTEFVLSKIWGLKLFMCQILGTKTTFFSIDDGGKKNEAREQLEAEKLGRSSGVYILPSLMARMMMELVEDQSSLEY